ncbi:unnamed protein product [marine sediment metagenome]|uniref:KaiC-like domain-containing protein n=1 Tax=marine sediment metagenome TaxID=412755 RepID=X1A8H2_9ZZZZ
MNGGLNTGIFTHVYGEAAAGKTTFGLQFVRAMYRQGMGTIYINSETTSPVERLEQMTGKSFSDLETLVKIFVPKGFSEQGVLIDDLNLYIRKNTRLVVVDTLTKYYRLALEDKKTNYANHRELNRQAGVLKGLARHNDIAGRSGRFVEDSDLNLEPKEGYVHTKMVHHMSSVERLQRCY